jgi:hypothetical protein
MEFFLVLSAKPISEKTSFVKTQKIPKFPPNPVIPRPSFPEL